MPLLRNTAQALTESVRVSGTTDAPYVAANWPNDATARMWYSKDGGTPVAIIPTRVDGTTGGWRLSTSILTAGVWDCDELRVFWEGTAILAGSSKYYPEALFTSTVAGRIDAPISGVMVLHTGTAQAGGASTITLANAAIATDNIYQGEIIWIVSGTGAGQVRVIASYVGATRVATVGRAWTAQPDNTTVYRILPIQSPVLDSALRVTIGSNADKAGYELSSTERTAVSGVVKTTIEGAGSSLDTLINRLTSLRAGYLDNLNGLTLSAIVAGVWDRATSALTTVGSVGKLVVDNLVAINSKTTNLPDQPAAVGSAMTLANNSVTAAALAADAVAEIADGVWDEALSGHAAAGSAGKALADAAISSSSLTADQSALLSRIAAVVGVGLDPGPDTGWTETRVGNIITRRHPIPSGGTLVHTITVSSGSQTVAVTYE